ncbi:hypothetical protein [Jhaorihella thermophila]|uniref:Metal binding domain of Ada n=1 Tax=Jhaorihella thermophila TaxID=488547 RepID=A0A1H5WNP8_9RHOB|nr:hypothetical protein [Jhaorihella thermophila]SEG00856.1 hypothetical protein SAMN05421751_108148 [Jhaorihella thermophila]
MPLQNRVLPTGEIVAHRARGLFMGNRGILHDDNGQLTHRRWRHKAWVTCALSFKGRRRHLMTPGRYTELFFHDEAVAFAAGHRPCAECRRADYTAFRTAAGIAGPVTAFDDRLHAARAVPRVWGQRRHRADLADLPDGAFILVEDGPHLVLGDALLPFAPDGYGPPRPRGQGTVTVLTPEPLFDALRGGYRLRLNLADAG